MIMFNANSLAINATQEVRDNIKKPNTAMTITDTRMTEEKLKRYKRDAKNANKILIAQPNKKSVNTGGIVKESKNKGTASSP